MKKGNIDRLIAKDGKTTRNRHAFGSPCFLSATFPKTFQYSNKDLVPLSASFFFSELVFEKQKSNIFGMSYICRCKFNTPLSHDHQRWVFLNRAVWSPWAHNMFLSISLSHNTHNGDHCTLHKKSLSHYFLANKIESHWYRFLVLG